MEYNRIEVGDRLKQKRIMMGMTQDVIAEKINRSPKYYADIERGSCGKSIETLLALAEIMDMPLDYLIYGKVYNDEEKLRQTDEVQVLLSMVNNATEKRRQCILRMIQLVQSSWIDE